MKCAYCGHKLDEEAKVCSECGAKISEDNSENLKKIDSSSYIILVKIILFVIAIAVVVIFFQGADHIESAAADMLNLRSVVGTSVNEAYYQYYGSFLSGLSDVIRGLGLTCGAIVLYISKRFDK